MCIVFMLGITWLAPSLSCTQLLLLTKTYTHKIIIEFQKSNIGTESVLISSYNME